jgi:hypothetical protein
MEANLTPPAATPQPGGRGVIGILLTIALVLVFLLVAVVFIIATLDVADVDTCEEAAKSGRIFVECFDGSSGAQVANIILGALSALFALLVVGTSVAWAAGRASSQALFITIAATVVVVIITFIV